MYLRKLASAHRPLLPPAQHLQQSQGRGAEPRRGASCLWGGQRHVPDPSCKELDECGGADSEGIVCGLHQIPEVPGDGIPQPPCCVVEDEGA